MINDEYRIDQELICIRHLGRLMDFGQFLIDLSECSWRFSVASSISENEIILQMQFVCDSVRFLWVFCVFFSNFLLTSDGERDDIVDAILKNNWRFK